MGKIKYGSMDELEERNVPPGAWSMHVITKHLACAGYACHQVPRHMVVVGVQGQSRLQC
jgi:hypothetical protein